MTTTELTLLVALIPLIGGAFGWVIKTLVDFRKENKTDHNVVMEAITELKTDVKEVKSGLIDHFSWHLKSKKK